MRKKLLALTMSLVFIFTAIPFSSSFAASAAADPAPTLSPDQVKANSSLKAATLAAENGVVFTEKTPTDAGYTVSLNGNWQLIDQTVDATEKTNMDLAPYDANGVITKNGPHDFMHLEDYNKVKDSDKWIGVTVPSDLHTYTPLTNSMRVWYRASVDVGTVGTSSYVLNFDGTCWIASVIVNGQEIGGKKGTGMPWKLDISKAMKDGANEICIGVKAPRYAIDPKGTAATSGQPGTANQYWTTWTHLSDYLFDQAKFNAKDPTKPTLNWNRTETSEQFEKLKWFAPIYPSSKGDTSGDQFGITGNLKLVVNSGKVYANDIFVKTTDVTNADFATGLGNGKISADVTLFNADANAKSVTVNFNAYEKGELAKAKQESREPVVAKALSSQTVSIDGRASKTISVDKTDWNNVKLWWPDVSKNKAPMYEFVAEVKDGSNVSAIKVQPFGFREIKIDGKYFRINGLRRNFWNALDGIKGNTPDEAVANFKDQNNRFERYGSDIKLAALLGGASPDEQLDWLDSEGLPVRYSTMIDGMFASFYMYNTDTNKVNTTMFLNFKDQIEDAITAYRNHPSIIVYSLENELLYINAALLYRAGMTPIESACKTYMTAPAKKLDPTRPSMYDGGGAFMDNSNEIFCSHYPEDQNVPNNSKSLTKLPKSQSLWAYNDKVPYVAGEVAFFSGSPAEHAWIGGPAATDGQVGAMKAYDKYVATVFNRFRYNDAAMTFPWFGSENCNVARKSMDALSVIRENYTTTLFENATKVLEAKVFNDTFSSEPVTFKWSLTVDGTVASSGEETLNIEPGFSKSVKLNVKTPATTANRTDAVLKLESSQGSLKWSDEQDMAIIKKVSSVKVGRKVYMYGANPSLPTIPAKYKTAKQKANYKKTTTYKNALAKYNAAKANDATLYNQLKSWGLKPVKVGNTIKVKQYYASKKVKLYKSNKLKGKVLKTIKKNKAVTYLGKKGKAYKVKYSGKTGYVSKKIIKSKYVKQKMNSSNFKKFFKVKNAMVIVGRNGIKSDSGYGDSAGLVRFARNGGRVVSLEHTSEDKMLTSQKDGLNELPVELNSYYTGSSYLKANYVFGQGFDRPIFQDIKQDDLSSWNYNAADFTGNTMQTTEYLWDVPSAGKAWASAGSGLEATAIVEIPVVKGLFCGTQFKINDRLKIEPVAQRLLANIIMSADKFSLPSKTTGFLSADKTQLQSALKYTGVTSKAVSSVASGLDAKTTPIFVVEATVKNLTELVNNKAKLKAYNDAGGWLMLWNLTPEGLDKYNELMDTQHMIRPARKELAKSVDDWTTIGLTSADFTLFNDDKIAPWANKYGISSKTFSYCIDATDNIAPFHDFEKEGTGNKYPFTSNRDGNPASMVNDLYDSDSWQYIYQIWVNPGTPIWDNTNPEAVENGFNVKTLSFTGDGGSAKKFNIKSVEVTNNANYNTFKDFAVTVFKDGAVAERKFAVLPDSYDPTTYTFSPAVEGDSVDLTATTLRNKGAKVPSCGIDNIKVIREQPSWIESSGAKSLTSTGGLVKYTRGQGGVILNNVNLTDLQDMGVSYDKIMNNSADKDKAVNLEPTQNVKFKYRIFSIMLQNLGAKLK